VSDILIENSNGAVVCGEETGPRRWPSATGRSDGLGPEWTFRGEQGDFLGDGHAGFLISNTAGAVVVGEPTAGATHYSEVAALGPEWTFLGER